MNTTRRIVTLTLTFGLSFLLVITAFFVIGSTLDTHAQGDGLSGLTLYVATTGSDGGNNCLNSASPCATLQHAVDQAIAGDEIRVAAGTYSGAQTLTHTDTYTYTQVVMINKGLTLRGGYTQADWLNSKPSANNTVIDPGGYGRGITVIGTLSEQVMIEGFTVTGGDYTGLGNPVGVPNQVCRNTGGDCGGGVYVRDSAVYLKDLTVFSNNGGDLSEGGGIYLWSSFVSVIDNLRVLANTADSGGGLHAEDIDHPLSIHNSTFSDNQADSGGGISLASSISSLVTIHNCFIHSNTATNGVGGGLYARLANNGNILDMDRVHLYENSSSEQGMAIYLDAAGPYSPIARMSNLILGDNHRYAGTTPTDKDAVIAAQPLFTNLTVEITHLTAVNNPVVNFLYAEPTYQSGKFVNVMLKNTLLQGFTNAFTALEGDINEVTIEHDHTLAYNVTNLHQVLGGTPTITALNPVVGDPKLDAYYHLSPGSAAIDTGMDAGITHDIDGNPRPFGSAPDVGADEFTRLELYLPLVKKP